MLVCGLSTLSVNECVRVSLFIVSYHRQVSYIECVPTPYSVLQDGKTDSTKTRIKCFRNVSESRNKSSVEKESRIQSKHIAVRGVR